MTHSGGKPHATGDRGQQYEISCYDHVHRRRMVVGWTHDLEIARGMKAGADLRPTWSEAKIKDRRSGHDDVR